ncbi:MAG TPA: hypothetical protein VH255_08965 [Verrucomicrobiae bacterium]|jgi:hypothetical protein|nr:hypothetical protein [Verrucomicrobiae bacterium]
MKHQSKFSPEEQQQAAEQENHQAAPQEFASVEEMLRYDAAHVPVPPRIEERLHASLGGEPRRSRSWWRRLLGK